MEEKIQTEIRRTKLPRGNQTLGILEERLGGSRARVKCLDGKTRICRIPGRLKRRLWVRPGDILLIEPWELSGDEKGDIIFKYRPTQVDVLRKKGMLEKLQDMDEF
ncbi:MAG: translation initiation factor eIF-1A [DPANN group archaeon]|nr:translation initiation factor eIF-1A [DPANN group archaeon]